MTKNEKTYTTKLNVVLDPRAAYTVADRKAQFDLVTRLAGLLNHMTWAVDAFIGVRDEAAARTAKLPEGDALRARLAELAETVDKIRAEVVATKEGGAITGEERLREFLAQLYGGVNGYEGKPTASQNERAAALGRELADVIRKFTELTSNRLPKINRDLQARKLAAIRVLPEDQWRNIHADELPAYQPRRGMPLYGFCPEVIRSATPLKRRRRASAISHTKTVAAV